MCGVREGPKSRGRVEGWSEIKELVKKKLPVIEQR